MNSCLQCMLDVWSVQGNSVIQVNDSEVCTVSSNVHFFSFLQYNRGRRSTNRSWVIGVVSTAFTPSRGYYKVVPRRNRQNIFPILEKCLRPGSILYTDDYTVYTNVQHLLPNHVSDHRIVNHSLNFVDQVTGVHTQNIESMWAKLKLPVKMRMGISRYDLQFYLDDRMWREWKGENDIFNNFITTLSLQYTNVPVWNLWCDVSNPAFLD